VVKSMVINAPSGWTMSKTGRRRALMALMLTAACHIERRRRPPGTLGAVNDAAGTGDSPARQM
jgi:hypothetical protein